jgi:tRNA1(Val) A37 N6-methylase TrmN6
VEATCEKTRFQITQQRPVYGTGMDVMIFKNILAEKSGKKILRF